MEAGKRWSSHEADPDLGTLPNTGHSVMLLAFRKTCVGTFECTFEGSGMIYKKEQ